MTTQSCFGPDGCAERLEAGQLLAHGRPLCHIVRLTLSCSVLMLSVIGLSETSSSLIVAMIAADPQVTTLSAEVDEDVFVLKVDTQGWEVRRNAS